MHHLLLKFKIDILIFNTKMFKCSVICSCSYFLIIHEWELWITHILYQQTRFEFYFPHLKIELKSLVTITVCNTYFLLSNSCISCMWHNKSNNDLLYSFCSLDSEGKKEITVCLIKPDAVAAGKVPEIIADVRFKT